MGIPTRSVEEYAGYSPRLQDSIAREPANIIPDRLWENYIRTRRPVVIEGALQDEDWKGDQWTIEHLREIAGDSMVKVEPKGRAGHFGTAAPRQTMPFSQFLDLMEDPIEGPSWYLTTQYEEEEGKGNGEECGSHTPSVVSADGDASSEPHEDGVQEPEVPELDAIFPNPTSALAEEFPAVPALLSGLVLQQANLWLGSSGGPDSSSSSGLHHDHHDNLYILLSGHKRFILFPPPAHRFLRPAGSVERVHPNGFIVYTPPDELPSTHRLSSFQGIRPDGLSPVEAAQWRLRSCARALRDADDRAAAASGEGALSVKKRKGKAKQTAEQAEALEKYIQAETLLLLLRLDEQGVTELDSLDTDEDSESLSSIDNFEIDRLSQLRENAGEDSTDDEQVASALHSLLARAAEGDEDAARILQPYLKEGRALPQFESHSDRDSNNDGSFDESGDEQALRAVSELNRDDQDSVSTAPSSQTRRANGNLLLTVSRLFDEIGNKERAAICQFRRCMIQLRDEGDMPGLNPYSSSLVPVFQNYLEDAQAGDKEAQSIILASFFPLTAYGPEDKFEECQLPERGPFEEDDDSLDLEARVDPLRPKAKISVVPPSLSKTHSRTALGLADVAGSEGDVTSSDESDSSGSTRLSTAMVGTMGQHLHRLWSGDDDEHDDDDDDDEDHDGDSDGELFPHTDGDDESDWEGVDGLEGEEILAELGGAAQSQNLSNLDGEAALAHLEELAAAGNDSSSAQTTPAEEDMPQSFSLIKPSVLHSFFGIEDASQTARRSNGNGSGTRLERRAMKRAATKRRRREASRLANGTDLTPLRGCPKPLVVNLKPGEMLYLPASWWHEVTSRTSSDGAPHMAFNYWMYPPTALDQNAEMSQAGAATKPTSSAVGSRHYPYRDADIWKEISMSVQEQVLRHKHAARQARLNREAEPATSSFKKSKSKSKRSRGDLSDEDQERLLGTSADNLPRKRVNAGAFQ